MKKLDFNTPTNSDLNQLIDYKTLDYLFNEHFDTVKNCEFNGETVRIEIFTEAKGSLFAFESTFKEVQGKMGKKMASMLNSMMPKMALIKGNMSIRVQIDGLYITDSMSYGIRATVKKNTKERLTMAFKLAIIQLIGYECLNETDQLTEIFNL